MKTELLKRIVEDFVGVFGEEKGVEMLRRKDSVKYVSDVAGLDSETFEAKCMRLALESGAFENLNSYEDYEAASRILGKHTGWNDDITDEVMLVFSEAMGLQVKAKSNSASAASASVTNDISTIEQIEQRLFQKIENDGNAIAGKRFCGTKADELFAEAKRQYLNLWTQEDFQKAFLIFKSAADEGSPEAMLELISLGEKGLVEISDLKSKEYRERALNLLTQRANIQSDSNAMVMIGDLLRMKEFNRISQAFRWYHAAHEKGCPLSACRIGEMYEKGEGTQINLQQAVFWYGISADLGNSDGMYEMALAYEKGKGTARDFNKALEFLTKAAGLGNVKAICRLGLVLDSVSYLDSAKIPAKKYCAYAALQGDADACLWCSKHDVSDVVAKRSASDWLVRSMLLGNAQASYEYACKLELREGPEYMMKNSSTLSYFERASKLGSVEAMLFLGRAFHEGKFVRRNLKKSFAWYESAAKCGSAFAMNKVSQMMYSGVGVERNIEKAEEWFDLAEQRQSQADDRSDDIPRYPAEVVKRWAEKSGK